MRAGDTEGGAWSESVGAMVQPCVQLMVQRPQLLVGVLAVLEQAIAATGVGKSATSVAALTTFVGHLMQEPTLRPVWRTQAATAALALASLRAAVQGAGVATDQFDSDISLLRL